MRTDDVYEEIRRVRERLSEIEAERDRLGDDTSSEKGDLDHEEHELRARLIRLQDATVKEWDTVELPGVRAYLGGRLSA
jgi:CBS domain containing-hemolysin-like protein